MGKIYEQVHCLNIPKKYDDIVKIYEKKMFFVS